MIQEETLGRKAYIDVARGVLIFLVVLGHNLENEMLSFQIIYSFHVPAFFFVSGFCFHANKYKNLRKLSYEKATKLLYPYYLFGFLSMLVYCVFKENSISAIKNLLLANRWDLMETPFNVPMWFIPCLFWVSILFFLMQKTNKKMLFALCVACSVIGYKTLQRPLLPHTFDSALYYLLFFYMGNTAKNLPSYSGKTKGWIYGAGLLIFPLRAIYLPPPQCFTASWKLSIRAFVCNEWDHFAHCNIKVDRFPKEILSFEDGG